MGGGGSVENVSVGSQTRDGGVKAVVNIILRVSLVRFGCSSPGDSLLNHAGLLGLGDGGLNGLLGGSRLLAGGRNFVSFVVLFSLSQSVGGLVGTALLSTFQVVREKFHSNMLVQHIVATDPLVAARLRAGAGRVAGVVGDPALRSAEGAALLAQQVAREANILAFNDVFLLVGVLAALTAVWGYAIRWSIRRRGEISPILLLQQKQTQAAQGHQG